MTASHLLFALATYLLLGTAIWTLLVLTLGHRADQRQRDHDLRHTLDDLRRDLKELRRHLLNRHDP